MSNDREQGGISMYCNIPFRLMGLDGVMVCNDGVFKKAVAVCIVTLSEEDYLVPQKSVFSACSELYAEALVAVESAGVEKYCDNGKLIRGERVSTPENTVPLFVPR